MIVPMKKVCLVVQDMYRDIALIKLRDLGVVHIERKEAPIDINSKAQKRKSKVDDAIGLILEFKLPKPKKKKKGEEEDKRPPHERRQKPIGLHRGRRAVDIFGTEEEEPYSLSAIKAPARPELSDFMLNIDKERRVFKDKDILLSHEIDRISSWGDFDPQILRDMNAANVPVFLYKLLPDDYAKLGKDVVYIKVKSDKSNVHLVVFEKEIKGIAPFQIPEKSLGEYLKEAKEVRDEISIHDDQIKNFANRRQALDKEMIKVEQDIEFEAAMAGMEKVNEAPVSSSSSLSWLVGYVPEEKIEKVKTAAKDYNWGLLNYSPEKTDERVPTVLKNNKVFSLLSPVTGFLGLLPGYHEVDISPFFLVFFTIFFGMIFGDAAYGIIIILLALAMIIKSIAGRKPIHQAFVLLLLLGISNTTWGVLTCSWFGMEISQVPQFLKELSLPAISIAYNDKLTVDKNIQIFCFSLGLVHLTIAHILNIIRYIKTPRFLAEIGSIAMLAGIYNVVLFLIVSRDIPVLQISFILIAGGFLLNFLFSFYEASLKQSVLSGLKNIIPVITGVINVFSDIMSYIRLWAVGLAGASIAVTINTLAGPTLGGFLIFAGIIILVFGHGLNMVLNVLSMLVHGVRLNTLEFSGHIGLSWAGMPYRPFAKKDINKILKKE